MSRNTKRHRRRRSSRFRYIAWAFQFVLLIVALGALGLGATALYQVSQRLPTIEELGLSAAATRIYSADGVLLARIYRNENRDYIHIKDIPQNLQDATVAIEDERFYSHGGLDMRGIGRALVSNLRGGSLGQGGSTITQQLARNAYNLGRQKTYSRKMQEAVVALRLERKYSKQEILEGYLNEVYYGAQAYGVQAAALQYFGKPADKLTLAECALLAGLPQRPTEFNPYKNKSAARTRRNIVLSRMAELGYITEKQAETAEKEPIRLAYKRQDLANDWKAPYFVDYVVRQLEDTYGPDQVYSGGLEVHTSLLYSMQQKAQEAVHTGLASAIRRGLVQPKIQAAMTCVDPHNGYIRAMVGGKNWDHSQFNRATNDKRQPGSTFKLFVYLSALNAGWNQWHVVSDTPKSWRQGNGKWWNPGNYDGSFRGPMSIRRAVANSVNMVAIKTADAIGIRRAIDIARKLGLKGDLPPYLATAIGAGGASTLEMAGAYGAMAVKGQFIEPNPIVEVRDRDGNILERANPTPIQAVKPSVVNEMDQMLRAVVTEGTGRIAGAVPDAFGKTGTTQDDRDAWFVGFTPQLATAVWIGNDDFSPMHHAFGGMTCGPIWVDFMQHALKVNPKNRPDYTNTSPAESEGSQAAPEVTPDADGLVHLKICTESGLIATNHCPHWRTRTYSPEDAPTAVCDVHPGTPLSSPARQGDGRRHADATGAADGAMDGTADVSPAADVTTYDSNGQPAPPRARAARATSSGDAPRVAGRDVAGSARSPRPAPRSEPSAEPAPSGTVVLCADTGLRANDYCPRTITRRLTASTPTAVCRLHGPGR